MIEFHTDPFGFEPPFLTENVDLLPSTTSLAQDGTCQCNVGWTNSDCSNCDTGYVKMRAASALARCH